MKITLNLFLFMCLNLVLLTSNAHAQDLDATIGNVEYSGSGCDFGTAAVVLSPDAQVLSIMFDDFIVEAGGEFFPRRSLKKCLLKIPVDVPKGVRVSLRKVDYRGYAFLPNMASMRFRSSYNFFYPTLNKRTYTLSKQRTKFGEMDDEYFITQDINDVHLWSKCGKDLELNLTAEIEAKTNRYNDEVYVTLDSADTDIESRVEYHLTWEKCIDTNNNNSNLNRNGHYNNNNGGNSTPDRDELRRRARCRRTGRC